AAYSSRRGDAVRGSLGVVPISAALWVAGVFAIAGLPPFALFVSEFTIVRGALAGGHVGVAIAFLVCLSIAFAAMLEASLPMSFGASAAGTPRRREPWSAVLPPIALAAAALALGLYLPPFLSRLLEAAAHT